jgi:hypothetical protein
MSETTDTIQQATPDPKDGVQLTITSQAGHPTGGRGGDVHMDGPAKPGQFRIASGHGGHRAPDGDIIFYTGDNERMRLGADGTITIRGEVVDSNVTVYAEFKRWIEGAALLIENVAHEGRNEGQIS